MALKRVEVRRGGRRDGRGGRRRVHLFEALEPRALLSAQIIGDLNPTPAHSNPIEPLTHGALTFFSANDNVHGVEYWRTDGTKDGTFLLKDITPGSDSSLIYSAGAAGKWVYFLVNYRDLWRTDGTPENTTFVADANGVLLGDKVNATARGTDFIFATGNALYLVSEQQSSASLITSIPAGNIVREIVGTGDKVYFLTTSRNLWVSDGSAAGTTRLVVAGTGVSFTDIGAVGDTLYYNLGGDLWKTQGTTATTGLVKDLPPTRVPGSLTAVGDTLYFAAVNTATDSALWKSDGTPGGTVEIKGALATPQYLTPAGDRVYFTDGVNTGAVWVSDGTAAGTVVISGTVQMYTAFRWPLVVVGERVFFPGKDATHGTELWTSDGVAVAPTLVADLAPGTANADPQLYAALNGKLLFVPSLPELGRELWVTDGTAANTTLLKEINTGTAGSFPYKAIDVNGKVLFDTVVPSLEAFVIPTPGAAPEKFNGGVADNLTLAGDRAYFTVSDSQLFVTDGSAAGTRLIKNLGQLILPRNFYAVGTRLFFTATGSANTNTLYTSDGTEAGTVAIASSLGLVSGWYGFEGRLYFSAQVVNGGSYQLVVSDGTVAGTHAITKFTSSPSGDSLNWITGLGDRLYFLAQHGKVYETDGTLAGTSVVTAAGTATRIEALSDALLLGGNGDIYRYKPGDSAPTVFLPGWSFGSSNGARVGKWFYFPATGGAGGALWRTDGTAQRTMRLSDVGTEPAGLTPVGDRLYFTGVSAAAGRELWTSDGTPGGTYPVADVNPGPAGSSTTYLSGAADGTLYFSANDGVHGVELWRAIDDIPPAPLAATFTPAAHSGSVDVTFTENVGASLKLSDWTLTNRATGQDVSSLLTSLTFNPDTDTATLTFANVLSDGDYRLSLTAGLAIDSAGNASVAPVTLDFFEFAADINHDRAVDFNDLVLLAQNYNTTGKTRAAGDLTGDGIVDFDDLIVLAQSYNTTLPPLPPAPAASRTPIPMISAAAKPRSIVKPAPPKRPASAASSVARTSGRA